MVPDDAIIADGSDIQILRYHDDVITDGVVLTGEVTPPSTSPTRAPIGICMGMPKSPAWAGIGQTPPLIGV